jgi:hypothetical protein
MAVDPVPGRERETLALFLEMSRSFHALVEPDELLPVITEKLRALLDAEACSVIPQKILAQGTDWRFLSELRKELKG